VRRELARRLTPERLLCLAADDDAEVRLEVARRLPLALLVWMSCDADWRVRYAAAERLPAAQLRVLLDDADPMVRALAQERHAHDTDAAGALAAAPDADEPGVRPEPLRAFWRFPAGGNPDG
jgi:hypothetical protein